MKIGVTAFQLTSLFNQILSFMGSWITKMYWIWHRWKHDTILMLFQNNKTFEDAPGQDPLIVMTKETKETWFPRLSEYIVSYQVPLKSGKLENQVEFLQIFKPVQVPLKVRSVA